MLFLRVQGKPIGSISYVKIVRTTLKTFFPQKILRWKGSFGLQHNYYMQYFLLESNFDDSFLDIIFLVTLEKKAKRTLCQIYKQIWLLTKKWKFAKKLSCTFL